jgi:hypothetical protein
MTLPSFPICFCNSAYLKSFVEKRIEGLPVHFRLKLLHPLDLRHQKNLLNGEQRSNLSGKVKYGGGVEGLKGKREWEVRMESRRMYV